MGLSPSHQRSEHRLRGTGEAEFSGDAYAGAGLLKSIDGGTTWTLLAAATFAKSAFSDIKVHPADPNTLLRLQEMVSRARRQLSAESSPVGIFKTTNGGATWSQTLSGTATDLEIDPSNFNNQYAALAISSVALPMVFIVPRTAGRLGRPLPGLEYLARWCRPRGAGHCASNRNTLYASIQDAFNAVGFDGGLLGLFRTTTLGTPLRHGFRSPPAPPARTGFALLSVGTTTRLSWTRSMRIPCTRERRVMEVHELRCHPTWTDITSNRPVVFTWTSTSWSGQGSG